VHVYEFLMIIKVSKTKCSVKKNKHLTCKEIF